MITLVGKIKSVEEYIDVNGIGYAEGVISVERSSGLEDTISFKAKIDDNIEIFEGDKALVEGSLRSYKTDEEFIRSKVVVYIRSYTVLTDEAYEEQKGTNHYKHLVTLYRKGAKVRTTPRGNRILDVALRTERRSGAYDVIPAILWGTGATAFDKTNAVGDVFEVEGRLQSRGYTKKTEDGASVSLTTHELSISRWNPTERRSNED